MTRQLQPSDYLSNLVLGFSVTKSMWAAFGAAIPNPSAWRVAWWSGGSVDIFADPNNPCWTANNDSVLDTQGGMFNASDQRIAWPANFNDVDRVILNVSGLCTTAADPVVGGYNGGARPNLGLTPYDTTGFTSSDPNFKNGYVNVVEYWRLYIGAAVANIRAKCPNVRMILLQPNIGGTGGGSQTACTTADANASQAGVVRCTYTKPYIHSACAALTRANVRMGFVQYAGACSDFADWAGHLNTTPQTTHGQAMAAYYAANL